MFRITVAARWCTCTVAIQHDEHARFFLHNSSLHGYRTEVSPKTACCSGLPVTKKSPPAPSFIDAAIRSMWRRVSLRPFHFFRVAPFAVLIEPLFLTLGCCCWKALFKRLNCCSRLSYPGVVVLAVMGTYKVRHQGGCGMHHFPCGLISGAHCGLYDEKRGTRRAYARSVMRS